MRKFTFGIVFLFMMISGVSQVQAAPIVPYANCGLAGTPANQCCFPKVTNSDNILGNTDFSISQFVVNKAIKLGKTVIFDFVPGIVDRLFDTNIGGEKELDSMLSQERIIAREKASFCETGTPVNKDDPNADDATLTQKNCICQVPPNTFAGQFGVNDADTTPLGRRCNKMTNDQEKSACLSCLNSINTTGKAKVWTAIGCIDLDLQDFMTKFVFTTLLGLAGILSLGCLIYWAIKLEYSGASADVQKKAREGIRQCLMGLILIIFSIFIIRLIGVDILSLPGIQ